MKRVLFLILLIFGDSDLVSGAAYDRNPFKEKPVFVYDVTLPSPEEDLPLGCFMGFILGDMLGIPFEFIQRNSFSFHKPDTESMRQALWPTELFKVYLDTFSARHFNSLGWLPGEWSDDASVALCLGASLIEKGFDLRDQLDKWVRWQDTGYMSYRKHPGDKSLSMTRILEIFKQHRKDQTFDLTSLGGFNKHSFTQKLSEGNSALARMAPLVLWASSLEILIKTVRQQTMLTHGASKSIESAVLLATILWKGLHTQEKNVQKRKQAMLMITPKDLELMAIKNQDVLNIALSSGSRNWKLKDKNKIKSTGFSLDTLESALWAFHRGDTAENVIINAIGLGGDTGTITSVAGQLAGACFGLSSFPLAWQERLWGYDTILDMGRNLLKLGLEKAEPL